MTISPEQMNQLELLIDANSLDSVVQALVEICQKKAAFARVHWKDEACARSWERDAGPLMARADMLATLHTASDAIASGDGSQLCIAEDYINAATTKAEGGTS